jgi:hypothetical protein
LVLIEFIIWEKLILKPYSEIVGTLTDIRSGDDNKIVLVFSLEKTIEVPQDAIEHDVLYEMKGDRIGVININGKYKIRKVNRRLKKWKKT